MTAIGPWAAESSTASPNEVADGSLANQVLTQFLRVEWWVSPVHHPMAVCTEWDHFGPGVGPITLRH